MSISYGDDQLCQRLPGEIWDLIVINCFADDEFFVVSCKALVKVLAVVSKTFNSELSKRAVIEAAKKGRQYRYGHSLANYCCYNGYASLLKYAIDNKAAFGAAEDMRIVIKSGHLDCLKVFLDHGCKLNIDRMNEAASNGHMSIVQYLVEKGVQPAFETMTHAVKTGKVEFVQFLQQHVKIDDYSRLGYAAASSGSLSMVKFIEQYTPLEQRSVAATAHGGSVEVLQYFINKGFTLNDPELCKKAMYLGFTDYVKLAIEFGASLSPTLMVHPVKKNDVELIKLLRAKGCPWDSSAVKEAARTGSFEALKYLVENGCPIDEPYKPRYSFSINMSIKEEATKLAAWNDQLACLQYLMERGAPWPKDIIRQSISSANKNILETIKYLHSRGCTWDANVCSTAAARGNLELLKFLHENNCPWNEDTCAIAAEHALRVNCLTYALDNGCPWDDRIVSTALVGSLPTLKVLLEKGIPLHENASTILLKQGKLDMLQYAHENGVKWSPDTLTTGLEVKAYNDILPCIKYAVLNGCPWNPKETLAKAQEFGHKDIVEWIQNSVMMGE